MVEESIKDIKRTIEINKIYSDKKFETIETEMNTKFK